MKNYRECTSEKRKRREKNKLKEVFFFRYDHIIHHISKSPQKNQADT
jgi:hypothetical protein